MAIQRVRPRVVRAHESSHVARVFQTNAGAAMPAYVIESMHGALAIANHDETFGTHGKQEIVAGAGYARRVIDEKPLSRAQSAQVPRKNLRIGIVMARETAAILIARMIRFDSRVHG